MRRNSGPCFAAIDFETADYAPDSACAVALVRVEGDAITGRMSGLIRPPRNHFVFTYLHGTTWNMARTAPTFGEFWPALNRCLCGVQFLAAHYARFDRSVLEACCRADGMVIPGIPFHCTA